MIEQTLVSGDLVKMSELEDLNGAFYDIDAQDLFDVWESMDSGNCELNGNLQGSNNNMPWNAFFRTTQTTPVLKDKLLTDSMINGEFPTAGVSTEHSYSLGRDDTGNGAASDGDSIPESPLSLQDDMETECYPCIPMQSASNQKRQSSAPFGCAQTTKMEVESNQEEDINVVDDEQQNSNDKVTYIANNVKVRNRASLVKRQANPPPTAAVNNLNNNNNSNTARVVLGGATKLPPQLRHTVRLTRPKHPQSLLKQQQPVLLMTTSMPSAPSTVQTSQSPAQLSSSIQSTATKVLTSAKLLPNTKEQLQQPQTSEVLYMTGGEWSPVSSPSSSCSSSSTSAKVAPINRTPIHTALISSQPNDGCGELVLTDEEKKTLISEGYPIPTKLPLTKAEERSLKKIRRKIKNKISAQESRRKKKEFVDTLERKVEEASAELNLYKKKCDLLQKENAALVEQVKCLRAMLEQQSANPHQNFTMKLEPDDDMDAIRNELDLD